MSEYLLSVNQTFMFKGEHCTVTRTRDHGFNYKKQSGGEGFMNWWFYKTIPSWKAKIGISIGLQRKLILRQKLIRAIDSVLL